MIHQLVLTISPTLRHISRTTRNSRQPRGGQSPSFQLRYQSASRCLVRPMYSSANLLPLYVIITATELSGGFFSRQSIKAGPHADVSGLPHSLPIVRRGHGSAVAATCYRSVRHGKKLWSLRRRRHCFVALVFVLYQIRGSSG